MAERTNDILPMEVADVDEVVAIERVSFPTPWSRASFLFEICENPFARNLVVKREGRVVAFACAWVVDEELKINNIAVAPAFRGIGLGRALLERLLHLGGALGCAEAVLEVRPSNDVARSLYERYGFREVGRRKGYYQDTQEDAILMMLDLR